MGYTHYWTIQDITKPPMTSEIAQDIQKIILASDVPIGDGCGAWDSKPVLEPDQVVLNGIDDDSHDTLWYPPVFEERRKLPPFSLGRNFCKTAQKPYDVCGLRSPPGHQAPPGRQRRDQLGREIRR